MLFPIFFIIAGALAKLNNIHIYGEGGVEWLACGYLNSHYLFCEKPRDYGCYCTDEVARATMAGCLGVFGKPDPSYGSMYCGLYYNASITKEQMADSYNLYLDSAADPFKTIPNYNMTTDKLTAPVLVNATAAHLYRDAYKVFLGNYDHSIWYGLGCIGYWFAVCIVAGIANWSVVLFPGLRNSLNGRISKTWRRYVTMPALWTKKRSTEQDFLGGVISFLIPSRLETLIVFVFFWFLFILCAVEIRYIPNDPIFATRKSAIVRFMADRTGIIATLLTPLLVLFGGRNNFLQWVTRWDFASFIVFHRWVARFMVMLAFVHSIAFTSIYIWGGYYAEEMKENYLIWGVIATTCGALICFQGLLFLRRAWYEAFLVIHIVLAVFFVVGLWFHISVLDYPQLVYPIFAIWGFDRFVRAVRVFYFGFRKAKIQLVANDALKVTVPKPVGWKSIPGGHAWLHFAEGIHFWQSHPFTFVEMPGENGPNIVFYCKIKGGITKTMCKKLANLPGRSTMSRVAVEGPYGEASPVYRHSSVTYIAGGNGIPGMFSETLALGRALAKRETQNQKVKLVWIMREMKSMAWFYNELKTLGEYPVDTVIYITRPEICEGVEELESCIRGTGPCEKDVSEVMCDNSSEGHSSDDAEKKGKTKEDTHSIDILDRIREELPNVCIVEGRPDLTQLVHNDIEEATSSAAFVTCGHSAMVDDLRYCVVKAMDTTDKRIDFYDKLQIWA